MLSLSLGLVTAHGAPLTHQGRAMPAEALSKPAISKALEEGFLALQDGKLDEAEKAFGRAKALDPRRANALLGLAEVELKRGRGVAAEQQLKAAQALEPQNTEVMVAYGRFHSSRGHFDRALALLNEAARIKPTSYAVQRDLGDLQLNGLKKPELAITAYKAAAQIEPDAVAPQVGMALAHLAAGRKPPALAALNAARKLAPKDPTLPHMVGRIHASEKNFELALEALNQALELQADFLPALSDRADVSAEMGQNAQAAQDLQRVVAAAPDNPTARLKLGMIYHRLDRLDEARASYLAALERNANLAVAYNNLATIGLRQKQDTAQIKAWAEKAVALAPKVPQFHDTLGNAYRAAGDGVRAIASLEQAVRLGPKDAEVQYHLARAYDEAGRAALARTTYQRALSLDPKLADAATARARLQALTP